MLIKAYEQFLLRKRWKVGSEFVVPFIVALYAAYKNHILLFRSINIVSSKSLCSVLDVKPQVRETIQECFVSCLKPITVTILCLG